MLILGITHPISSTNAAVLIRDGKIISAALSKNKDKVAQYKSGKVKLFGYFVGEVMKVSKGKANPQLVNEILKAKLK